MRSFPSKLIPENKPLFSSYKLNRDTCKLRAKIYEYLLSGKDDGLDLRSENNTELYNLELAYDPSCINTLIEELKQLGWHPELRYGDTMLFIHDKPIQ